MLSFKSFAFVLGALVAVSAICGEATFHGRNGLDLGFGLPGIGGGGIELGLGLPGIGIGFGKHHGHGRPNPQPTQAPTTQVPTTQAPTTTAAPTTTTPARCNCPINRRCGPNCDQHAFQADVRAFKSAGCCVATPCQMRGNRADYEDFKSYVCSRNFNC